MPQLAMPGSKSVVVTDGTKKYRLLMEGDIETVTVGKLKRYLSKSTGVDPTQQVLRFNGAIVLDAANGADIGLYDGASLNLEIVTATSRIPSYASSASAANNGQHRPQHLFIDANVSSAAPPPPHHNISAAAGPVMSPYQPPRTLLPASASTANDVSTAASTRRALADQFSSPAAAGALGSAAHNQQQQLAYNGANDTSMASPAPNPYTPHPQQQTTNAHDAALRFVQQLMGSGSNAPLGRINSSGLVGTTTANPSTTSTTSRVGGPGGMLSPHGARQQQLDDSTTNTNLVGRSTSATRRPSHASAPMVTSTTAAQQQQPNSRTTSPLLPKTAGGAAAAGSFLATAPPPLPPLGQLFPQQQQHNRSISADANLAVRSASNPVGRRGSNDQQYQQHQHRASSAAAGIGGGALTLIPTPTTTTTPAAATSHISVEREAYLIADRDALIARDKEREEWSRAEQTRIDDEYKRLREDRRALEVERRAIEADRRTVQKQLREVTDKEEELRYQQSEDRQRRREEDEARSRRSHEGSPNGQAEREEVIQLRTQLKYLQRSQSDLQTDLARLKKERDEDFDRLIAEHDAELEMYRKNHSKADTDFEKLRALLDTKNDRLEEAREDVAKERKASARVAEQLNKQLRENADLKNDLINSEDRCRELEAMLKVQTAKAGKAIQAADTTTNKVSELEGTIAEMNGKMRALREELATAERSLSAAKATAQLPAPRLQGYELVKASLHNFAVAMRVPPLKLDDNLTCVVTLEGGQFSLLVTHDPTTEKLFLYSTLLNQLPQQDSVKLHLYEELLEGALLGREMAGGGVGISRRNGLVILSVCCDLKHGCDEYTLANLAKPFVDAVRRWIATVEAIAGVPLSQSLVHPRDEVVPMTRGSGGGLGGGSLSMEQTSPNTNNKAPNNGSRYNRASPAGSPTYGSEMKCDMVGQTGAGTRNTAVYGSGATTQQPQYTLSEPRREGSYTEAF